MAPSATSIGIDTTAQTGKAYQHREALKPTGVLDQYKQKDLTPVIGTEFLNVNLVDWLNAPNSDELLRDLAIKGISILLMHVQN